MSFATGEIRQTELALRDVYKLLEVDPPRCECDKDHPWHKEGMCPELAVARHEEKFLCFGCLVLHVPQIADTILTPSFIAFAKTLRSICGQDPAKG